MRFFTLNWRRVVVALRVAGRGQWVETTVMEEEFFIRLLKNLTITITLMRRFVETVDGRIAPKRAADQADATVCWSRKELEIFFMKGEIWQTKGEEKEVFAFKG